MAEPATGASPRRAARVVGALAVLATLLLASVAFEAIAQAQARRHLIDTAARLLRVLDDGDTPYRWPLRARHDLVAGRAFDAAEQAIGADGLHLRLGDDAIEVGLPLAHPVDLRRFGQLGFDAESTAPVRLELIAGRSLDSTTTPCRAEAGELAAGTSAPRIDLRRLGWRCDDRAASVPVAAWFRLHLAAPADTRLTLREVRLDPDAALRASAPAALVTPHVLPSTAQGDAFAQALEEAVASAPIDGLVAFQLAPGTVERQLDARDRIQLCLPDSLVLPPVDAGADARADVVQRSRLSDAPAKRPAWLGWLFVLAYALALTALRRRPPARERPRAALELLAALVVPLWLVGGGHFTRNADAVTLGIIAVGLLYALSFIGELRGSLRHGALDPRGWLVAAGCVALAAALVWHHAGGGTPPMPTPERTLRYVGWAAVQQILLCVVISERAARLFRSRAAAIAIAAIAFGLLHTPNAALMQYTLFGGAIWAWNWQRHRALPANVVAHAACGLLLAYGLPPAVLHSAEVGARFFL